MSFELRRLHRCEFGKAVHEHDAEHVWCPEVATQILVVGRSDGDVEVYLCKPHLDYINDRVAGGLDHLAGPEES